ncbi:crispr-associated protein, Csx11 family [Sulfurihydrogenibium azorense Az-Fu1]|uniref:Crispr-associated protein, Csx11 family n=1 Tax=Sulfurihydrogenibium azorense (strain DSM 15241 / OCM 825 / Az-Fu1) TaxID=204536 RepID=C1DUQ1_SULAA|nr:CRISPR-associated protein Csx11 [Sulfurihydrogenibium azorense]ACN98683.1 crispr-associated protein, Csx11 family [Sulfurihydrogenibium azorense Az-Fu1]
MSGLNRIKNNKDEILKAEIVSYLALWEKLNPSKQNRASINIQCNNLSCWESALKNSKIDIRLEVNSKSFELWDNFLKDWRGWRKKNDLDFLLQILYGISESLNSGIDKGSPKEDVKVKPEEKRWLANAFGSYKEDIIYLRESENIINGRIQNINNKVQSLLGNSHIFFENLEELRKELKELLSGLLSDDRFPINDVSLWDQAYMTTSMFKALLSDYILINQDFTNIPDRQEVRWRILGIQYNKLGLAEKGFKLASIEWYRQQTKEIDDSIKKLLEVEYPIGNEVYRDDTGIYFIVGENLGKNKDNNLAVLVDDLKPLEEEIINIFNEKLEGEVCPVIILTKASRGLMNLGDLLEKAKENFLYVKTDNKITQTLMQNVNNTSTAIGICPLCKVRLIYEYDKQKNNSPTICKTCDERIHHYQVKKWLEEISKETIWTSEIKDKNDRIALISLRLELKDWLNGNMLNSLLGNMGLGDFTVEKGKIIKLILKGIVDTEIQEIINKIEKEICIEKFKNLYTVISLKDSNGNFICRENLNTLQNEIRNTSNRAEYGALISVVGFIRDRIYGNQSSNQDGYILKILENLDEFLKKLKISQDLFQFVKQLQDSGFYSLYKTIVEKLNELKAKLDSKYNSTNSSNFDKLIQYLRTEKSSSSLTEKEIKEFKQEIENILTQCKPIQNFDIDTLIKNSLYPFSINEELLNFYSKYNSVKEYFNEIFFGSIIGTQWENWIKQTPLNAKINWQDEKIEWDKFTDENDPALDILSTLLLQFLLRKNPSPARLRRIWETTQNFFEEIKREILDENLLGIPNWRRKRIVFELPYIQGIKDTGEELEGDGLLFWALPSENKDKTYIYLISSIEDFIRKYANKDTLKRLNENNLEDIDENNFEDFKIELKKYSEKENRETGSNLCSLQKSNIKNFVLYNSYASITDPTPVGWQVIIPTEYVPKFIDLIMEKYNKEFKYVYGKLPIHIGIIIQDYKKPLYIGLNALRKIRRDVKNIDKLYQNGTKFCMKYHQKILNYAKPEELCNSTQKYYSLYWDNKQKTNVDFYDFYIKPNENWKKTLSVMGNFVDDRYIEIIPNTFDFEFLDTNTRRNDIFYLKEKNYKRAFQLKSNRPYEIEEYWDRFKRFRDTFKDKTNTAKLHKLVNIFYDKIENYNKDINPLLASSIVNILELNKNKDLQRDIAFIFGLDEKNDIYKELVNKLNSENIKLFLDMFEFWSKALQEV